MAYQTTVAKAYTTRQGYWDDIKTFFVAAGWTEVSPDAGAVTVAYTAVDTTGETITYNSHPFTNGMTVIINSTGTAPGNLAINTQYFIVGAATNTFQLSSSVGGAAINITSQGTGNHTIAGCLMVYSSAGTYADRLAEYVKVTRLTANQIIFRSGLRWTDSTKVLSAMGYSQSGLSGTTEGSFTGWMYGDSNIVTFLTKVSTTYYGASIGHLSHRFVEDPNIILKSGWLGKVETACSYGINVPNIDDYEVGRYYLMMQKDLGRSTIKVASKTTARTDHDAPKIPTMTSNSAPSPVVMSASSEYSATYAAWKSVDGAVDDFWLSSGVVMPIWLKVDLGSGNGFAAVIYALHGSAGFAVNALKNWTFEGSNNDSAWTVLDTQTNQTGWSAGETRVFQFSNSTSYRYYRLNISAINGGATYGGAVCGFNICGGITPAEASNGQLLLDGSNRGTFGYNYYSATDCRFGTVPTLFGAGSYDVWGDLAGMWGITCPMGQNTNNDCASTGYYWQSIGGVPSMGGVDVVNANSQMVIFPQWFKNMTTALMGYPAYNEAVKVGGCDSTGMATEDLLYVNSLVTGTSSGSNTGTTLNDTSKSWSVNAYANKCVVIGTGTGLGQARKISSNTATELTISAAWSVTPDATSTYVIADEAWRYFAKSMFYEAP